MITVGLLSIFLVSAIGVLFFFLTRLWTLETAFVRVSWVPLTALLLEGVLFERIANVVSYAAIAIPVLTCVASMFLGVIGTTLVMSAREHREPTRRIVSATLLASIPALILTAYVLYASLAHAAWSCA